MGSRLVANKAYPAGRRLSGPGPSRQSTREARAIAAHGCPRRGIFNSRDTDPECCPSGPQLIPDSIPFLPITQIHRLRQQLADVALGKAFLLQGGDCAELFDYCAQVSGNDSIRLKSMVTVLHRHTLHFILFEHLSCLSVGPD